jgi:hypothetical protein
VLIYLWLNDEYIRGTDEHIGFDLPAWPTVWATPTLCFWTEPPPSLTCSLPLLLWALPRRRRRPAASAPRRNARATAPVAWPPSPVVGVGATPRCQRPDPQRRPSVSGLCPVKVSIFSILYRIWVKFEWKLTMIEWIWMKFEYGRVILDESWPCY